MTITMMITMIIMMITIMRTMITGMITMIPFTPSASLKTLFSLFHISFSILPWYDRITTIEGESEVVTMIVENLIVSEGDIYLWSSARRV